MSWRGERGRTSGDKAADFVFGSRLGLSSAIRNVFRGTAVIWHGSLLARKVVQTDLAAEEYRALVKIAEKKGLTIKQALREAALRWTSEEFGIEPKDPIFDIALGRRKAQDWGKGTEEISIDHDKILYVPPKSLGELRGAFKAHEKLVREGIRELEAEHRKEARS